MENIISNAPDVELVKNIQLFNCNDSLRTLIDRHSPLAYGIINKFSPRFEASGVRVEDVRQEKDFILYKSAQTYKPDKNTKFSTWYANQVRYECLNLINPTLHKERYREIPCESEQVEYLSDKNTNKTESLLDIERVKEILDEEPDKRVKEIFLLRYFDDKLTFRQIGTKLGCCSETARNLHEKGRKILLEKIKEIL